MLTLDEFEELKRQMELLKTREAIKDAELNRLTKEIKEDTGLKSIKELMDLLEQLKQEEKGVTAKYIPLKKQFKKKWGKYLDMVAEDTEED